MKAELRTKRKTIGEGVRGEGIEKNHSQSVIITMYLPSKTNGAPLSATPRTHKFNEKKITPKVKSDAETNAIARRLLVSRTDSLCFCCLVFFSLLQLLVKFHRKK